MELRGTLSSGMVADVCVLVSHCLQDLGEGVVERERNTGRQTM